VRGAVIDGATRDAAYISRIRFPTFVRYRTPQDSVPRWRVSDWGQPLTIGGVRIALGDVVVADLDGVVVIPRRAASEVLARCEKLVGTENKVRTAVKAACCRWPPTRSRSFRNRGPRWPQTLTSRRPGKPWRARFRGVLAVLAARSSARARGCHVDSGRSERPADAIADPLRSHHSTV